MKKILVVYQSMVIGGSTTSLISFLNSIDKKQFDIDLLLSENKGDLFDKIPDGVNVLPQGRYNISKLLKLIVSMFHKEFYRILFYRLFVKKKKSTIMQLNAYNAVSFSRRIKKKYDVAIGYMELWPDSYVLSNRIKADKKVIWIHTDYLNAGLDFRVDKPYYKKADKIVLVSNDCLKNFQHECAEYSSKAVVVENILDKSFLKTRSKEYKIEVNNSAMNFLTVCRLDVYTKGLDRLVNVASRLKNDGYEFQWYVVGDGDIDCLRKMCLECGVDDRLIFTGHKSNPYPFFTACDCFVLPSRYEGKPMVITEAQMLALPAVVTEYATARDQIKHGVEGLVVNNSEDGLYSGLKRILDAQEVLKQFAHNLLIKDFDYKETIEKINGDLLI